MNISRRHFFSALLQLVFLVAGCGLVGLFLQRPETAEAWQKIQEAHLWPLWFIGAASVLVYVLRALRWQQVLQAANEGLSLPLSFATISVGYLVSFGLPRAGELVRCYVLQKRNKTPLGLSLGTVVAERLVDLLMLVAMMMLCLLLQMGQVVNFFIENIFVPLSARAGRNTAAWLAVALLLGLLLGWWLFGFIKKKRAVVTFSQGLTAVLRVHRPWVFWGYTAGIWLCYFLMTWLWFFMFDATAGLGLLAGLSVFTIGTLGRSVPVQGGGMGAYHFLVGQALVLYGCSPAYGASLAILIHGGQTFFTFAAGIPSLLWLLWRRSPVKL